MSLGFVPDIGRSTRAGNAKRPAFQEPTVQYVHRAVDPLEIAAPASRSRRCNRYEMFVIALLLCQSAANFAGFAWVGIVLKWPLVYGDLSHGHPHEPEEEYIWRPNNYLNIAMIALAVDLFEPLWLLVMYCRNKSRTQPGRTGTYSCCTGLFFLYSFLCLLLVGGLCAIAVPITMSSHPQETPALHNHSHEIHDVVFKLKDLVVFYVLIFFVAAIKLVSYWQGLPYAILQRKLPTMF